MSAKDTPVGAEKYNDRSKLKDALLARYYYLKRGGEWGRELLPSDEFASPADNYTAGFLDAMTLLGVKP